MTLRVQVRRRQTLSVLAVVQVTLMVCLSGCATHNAGKSVSEATISGKIVEVGGASNATAARPFDGVAALYGHESKTGSVTGEPVAFVTTSVSDGGRFTLSVPPGPYYIVAQDVSGTVITTPKPVDLALASPTTFTIEVDVP